MRYLTATQMRETDRRCIEDIGIPGVVLMNNAGTAVFREIDRKPVGIICGKGNNGGDGFVVARLALLAGMNPRVILCADPESIRGDAAVFLRAYRKLGGPLTVLTEEEAVPSVLQSLSECELIVDALLGTGLKGEVRGLYRAVIENWPRKCTLAVDIPSGLDADRGIPLGCCVRANCTVTFQYPKMGFKNPQSSDFTGWVRVADIGIPPCCADDTAWEQLQEKYGNSENISGH